jgi:ribosome-binding protein aMBF1 (putative translation factor)
VTHGRRLPERGRSERSHGGARLSMSYSLSPRQCRSARVSLGWNQAQLASRAQLARKTVADFESGAHPSNRRTVRDLRHCLELGGIGFIDAGDEPIEGLTWSIAAPAG